MDLPTFPTQASIDANLKYLRDTISNILVAELGQYELVKGSSVVATIPAIRVEPRDLDSQFRFKAKSGIECVISRNPNVSHENMINSGLGVYLVYKVILRQYDITKSTQLATMKLLRYKDFTVFENPRIVPYTELSTGFSYETSSINIQVGSWYLKS